MTATRLHALASCGMRADRPVARDADWRCTGRIAGVRLSRQRLFPPSEDGANSPERLVLCRRIGSARLWLCWSRPGALPANDPRPIAHPILAGLLVGFGSVWGHGAPRHGVRLSRLSMRSLVAPRTLHGRTGIATPCSSAAAGGKRLGRCVSICYRPYPSGLAVLISGCPIRQVLTFLDLAGIVRESDPSLAFVMAGASPWTFVCFQTVLRQRAAARQKFHLPTKQIWIFCGSFSGPAISWAVRLGLQASAGPCPTALGSSRCRDHLFPPLRCWRELLLAAGLPNRPSLSRIATPLECRFETVSARTRENPMETPIPRFTNAFPAIC